jgi:hypothetical protein
MAATRWEAMKNPAARTKGDPKYQVREPDGWPVALVWQERDLSLVAAAPDLLTALRAVMSWVENWDCPFKEDDDWPLTRDQVAAAIAKATGQ